MALTVAGLLDLLRLRRETLTRFTGWSPPDGARRIYGGQMLAQSIMAMGQTVREPHRLHSMQGYFLQPGDVTKPITFDVRIIREGRNFSTRLVLALQDDTPIFSGAASFQSPEGEYRHFQAMPEVFPPERMQSEEAFYADQLHLLENCRSHVPLIMRLFERRSDQWRRGLEPGPLPPVNGIWCRLREPCGDDPLLAHALLAYVCDLDLMSTAMRPRGRGSLDRTMQAASLDHAMWFHAPIHPERWFYYDLEGPCATNNRGLGRGALYQDGYLVGTAMQEGLLRERRDHRPDHQRNEAYGPMGR
ncbi:acyl-CoA thioesterase [Paraburkholderia dioscoreae]|uniref:Acyl-CoA thioesterase II n=1 Tax=Paraburkholderia dioscoreae TaxID=2604047 RepID=A0A5Q4ZJU1_9BURK|nr:acyl-CoA thioesterase domain-containing protein [Paraburkholderia dioscoreae]VVD33765.1 Acyl-CoA thioesterase II [Paraburkholderia dioscoreae]